MYRELILVGDGGRAYLESMSSLERTSQKRELYEGVVDSSRVPYPVQLVWGAYDRVFPLRTHGFHTLAASRLPTPAVLSARHYLQEDFAPELAELVARHASGAG